MTSRIPGVYNPVYRSPSRPSVSAYSADQDDRTPRHDPTDMPTADPRVGAAEGGTTRERPLDSWARAEQGGRVGASVLNTHDASPEDAEATTLLEAMKRAQKQAEEAAEQRKKWQVKSSASYGNIPMEAYARLNRARTQSEVSAAAGYARRRLAQLRVALRQDGDHQAAIRSAMRQLEKATLRASRKKRDLSREELLQLRRRRTAEQERLRESDRLRLEYQRRRSLRAVREGGYLREAVIERGMQAYREAKEMETAARLQVATGGAAGGDLPTAEAGAGAIAPAAVSTGFSVQT